MLQKGEQQPIISQQEYVTRAQFQETEKKVEETHAYLEALLEAERLTKVYRISTNHPGHRKLSDRLGITQEEARDLVLSGKIRSKYIGPDNDRARHNGASYLISEQAVQEFLQNTSI
jgi:hypothetical protein